MFNFFLIFNFSIGINIHNNNKIKVENIHYKVNFYNILYKLL